MQNERVGLGGSIFRRPRPIITNAFELLLQDFALLTYIINYPKLYEPDRVV